MPESKMGSFSMLFMTLVFCCATFGLKLVASQPTNQLVAGQQISNGESRTSSNGVYRFVMQSDCNLVLYRSGAGALWDSNTVRDISNCYFIMQTDGNAVIYGGSTSNVVFATGTNGRNDGAHYIEVQNDGNTVMYNDGRVPLWSTNTSGQ